MSKNKAADGKPGVPKALRRARRPRAIIVLAASQDQAARRFVERNAGAGLCLMTPRDLSRAGWAYRVGRIGESRAAVGEAMLGAAEIAGVLTRIAGVTVQDLPHIKATDRAYVAEEMTAFLLAWLMALECPMLNRPMPQSLTGPGWSADKWVATAAGLGIPVMSSHRKVALSQEPVALRQDGTVVTVIGQRLIGATDSALHRAARILAGAAATDLLSVRFSCPRADGRFMHASPSVDLDDDETGAAVLDFFRPVRQPRQAKAP